MLLCPSAIPEMKGSFVFAVIGAARARYIEPMRTDEALAAIADTPEVSAAEVFRFAAPCVHCAHWTGHQCGLGARVSRTGTAPGPVQPCPIRPQCRWFQEQGTAACTHCPEVITLNYAPVVAAVTA